MSRQRGFYSEFLAPETSNDIQRQIKEGPADKTVIHVSKKQTIPRAMNPIRKGEHSRLNRTNANDQTSLNQSKILQNTTSRYNFLEAKEPTTTVGLYSKQQEGVADAEPKVMEPYVPIPGRVPRKVELDRLKKDYKGYNIKE